MPRYSVFTLLVVMAVVAYFAAFAGSNNDTAPELILRTGAVIFALCLIAGVLALIREFWRK